MRTCIKCGNVIENDIAKFCKKCGSPLKSVSQPIANTSVLNVSNRTSISDDNGILLGVQPLEHQKNNEPKNIVQQLSNSNDSTHTYKKKAESRNMGWAIKSCFKKYATFSGRASRSEYWYFALFNNLLIWILIILAIVVDHRAISLLLCIAALFYMLAVLIPGLAVSVRRLHDIGKSGAYYFISFIPFVGGFILLYFFCKASEKGKNIYGLTN